MYEATFHIRGDVAYEDATAGRDVSIELWCNDHCDLLHVRGDEDDVVASEIEAAVGLKDVISRGEEKVLITEECLRPFTEGNVEEYLERHDCLLLPPLRYESGGKVVRVLTLDPENLTRFYQDVQESFRVTVRSKREVDTVTQDRPLLSLDSLVPDLSARQEEAVVNAWEGGYYAIPRDSTTEALADDMGIDRRTFEEHLRLAENKLIGTLVEELFA
ncbi:transcriptional regulator [Halorubellus sp. JP-L1]|uniref:helix-turn-helix domain-containing protein n=1 Tax=Halorubellus sp. JP-L1 TaxID=2715753 RepID=UPI00140748F9|nr:helix-turn-helix domain-containing protein [Halorubellus sp. JP-L1]NHN43018.1 transcriptional regulator [Halorubellus sp. JP-L1]